MKTFLWSYAIKKKKQQQEISISVVNNLTSLRMDVFSDAFVPRAKDPNDHCE